LIKDIHRHPSQNARYTAIIISRYKILTEMASVSTPVIVATSPFDIPAS